MNEEYKGKLFNEFFMKNTRVIDLFTPGNSITWSSFQASNDVVNFLWGQIHLRFPDTTLLQGA